MDRYKVIYTDTFVADLEAVSQAVAAHNPSAAYQLGTDILDYCKRLTTFPHRFPRAVSRPTIRRFVCTELI